MMTFSKAGKDGLVAVKKQVTKKGKTFTQTFYVKPDTPPSAPTAPAAVDVLPVGQKYAKPHYNRPDGFYAVTAGDKAYRIPEKYVKGTFEYMGARFVVIHHFSTDDNRPKFGDSYQVRELSTSLPVGMTTPYYTFDAAKSGTADILDRLGQDMIDRAVARGRKVDEYFTLPENLVTDTENYHADPISTPLSPSDVRERIVETLGAVYDSEDPDDWGVTPDQAVDWVAEHYTIVIEPDYRNFDKEIADPVVLEHAIYREVEYADAEVAFDNIAKISDEIGGVGLDPPSPSTIEEWLYSTSRVEPGSPIDVYSYGAYPGGDYDDEIMSWDSGTVINYAIENDIPLHEAQSYAEEDVEEQSRNSLMSEDDYFETPDGLEWALADLQSLGSWVRGAVQSNRSVAKEMFNARESGQIEPDYYHESVVGTVESHLTTFPSDKVLFRGTKNLAYGELDVGDVVPLGMGSFSHSMSSARTFAVKSSDAPAVIFEIQGTDDNLLMGCDLPAVIDSGRDAGFARAIGTTGVDAFEDEEEVIVMAPAMEIVGKVMMSDTLLIRVKPVKTDLIRMMKSKLSKAELIALAEKTFDYPIHREPEGAFEDVI